MPDPIIPLQTSTKSDRGKENDNNLVFSYMTLRNLIGLSGMLLPFVLVIFTKESNGRFTEPSISDYYYTANGDLLVVLLSVLGVFLFCYRGYNWKEKAWTTLAAVCGIGVAFSPTRTRWDIDGTRQIDKFHSVHSPNSTVANFLGFEQHLMFAAIFFIALAIIALAYFPKSSSNLMKKPDGKRTAKAKRNIVYRICGWTMLACVFILAMYMVIKPFGRWVGDFPLIFTLETVAIQAFGISWLTKGETLWPDGEHYMVKAWRDTKENLKQMKAAK
jgi:uncharacterized membrane protein YbhN (UPF0104 family)